MQQIADWLGKLGMSEYAQLFAENRIDFSVLPDLTDQDLEKLGVVLGDRRNACNRQPRRQVAGRPRASIVVRAVTSSKATASTTVPR
jgi:hypothetical protein